MNAQSVRAALLAASIGSIIRLAYSQRQCLYRRRLSRKYDKQAERGQKPFPRGPLDDLYIKSLIWQHKGHLFKGGTFHQSSVIHICPNFSKDFSASIIIMSTSYCHFNMLVRWQQEVLPSPENRSKLREDSQQTKTANCVHWVQIEPSSPGLQALLY